MMLQNREFTFEELYGEYYFWLLNQLHQLTNDREMSKDLVQQTFFTVYCVYFICRKHCLFDCPKYLLYRTALTYHKNLIKNNNNFLKSQRHYSPDHIYFNEEVSMEVLDGVNKCLSGEAKIYFVMYFYYGFSYGEIAKLTKTPIYSIRISISHSIKILQKGLNLG